MNNEQLLQNWEKLSRDIRIELFAEIEKHFIKGFDDFSKCWCIDMDQYIELKKEFL